MEKSTNLGKDTIRYVEWYLKDTDIKKKNF